MLTVITAIPHTFFSRQFYRDLNRRWTGIGLGFALIISLLQLAYLMFIITGPGIMVLGVIPRIAESLPVATFTDHQLSIDQPSPYYVQLPGQEGSKDSSPILIDTNYEITDLTALSTWMQDNKVSLLVTGKQAVVMEGKGRDLRVYNYKTISDTVITKEQWVGWAQEIVFWIPAITIPFLAFGVLISAMIKVLFGALLLFIIGLATNSLPDFDAKMRVAAAASVPPTLLFLLVPHYGWLKFGLWIGYLIFGALAARLSPRDQLLLD